MLGGALLLAGWFFMAGCSHPDSVPKVQEKDFAAAPAESKQLWGTAMTAWKAHHWVEAATNFMALRAAEDKLSPELAAVLQRGIDEFGTEAFKVADAGDAGAVDAVKLLRASSGRGRPTQ